MACTENRAVCHTRPRCIRDTVSANEQKEKFPDVSRLSNVTRACTRKSALMAQAPVNSPSCGTPTGRTAPYRPACQADLGPKRGLHQESATPACQCVRKASTAIVARGPGISRLSNADAPLLRKVFENCDCRPLVRRTLKPSQISNLRKV